MQDLPIFVAGVVVGLLLAGAALWVRGRSVGDLGAGMKSETAGTPSDASAEAAPPDLAIRPGTSVGVDRKGLHVTQTKVVRRVATRLEPGGRLTVTVDGQDYHRLEDIPDPATRDQVRATLESLPGQVTDPALREKVEGELHDAGIDPRDV
jgi:hypothetical protein